MRMHQIKTFYNFAPYLGEIYLFGKKKQNSFLTKAHLAPWPQKTD